jgi:hypothetical protein
MNVRELKAWALKNGVEVKLPDGSSFNSEGLKAVPRQPAPAAIKEVEKKEPQIIFQPKIEVKVDGIEKVAKLLESRLPMEKEEEEREDEKAGWEKITMRVTERDAGGNIREVEIWRVK